LNISICSYKCRPKCRKAVYCLDLVSITKYLPPERQLSLPCGFLSYSKFVLKFLKFPSSFRPTSQNTEQVLAQNSHKHPEMLEMHVTKNRKLRCDFKEHPPPSYQALGTPLASEFCCSGRPRATSYTFFDFWGLSCCGTFSGSPFFDFRKRSFVSITPTSSESAATVGFWFKGTKDFNVE
jgi:hypothetical protein